MGDVELLIVQSVEGKMLCKSKISCIVASLDKEVGRCGKEAKKKKYGKNGKQYDFLLLWRDPVRGKFEESFPEFHGVKTMGIYLYF